ncbi:MAG: hypothetical protein ABIN89_25670 [Chitinophagaceae bacterium]
MANSVDTNPFVGLRPFESHESLLFFGRQTQILDLLQRLHKHHFVSVIGNSGSGKSSLIRAGLIPRLKAGFLVHYRDRWIISIMKPGQNPLYNLAEAILSQLAPAPPDLTVVSFADLIKEEGINAVLKTLAPACGENTNFFLLVDQFEELFRFAMEQDNSEKKDEAIDFVNILLELFQQKDLPIYIALTMRSDFIGDCARFYGLPEAMNESQYIVPRLTRVQLKISIEAPIRLYNGNIDPALTARLLNDVQLVKDELPLLQHALMRTWDHEINIDKNGVLNLNDYESIGGMQKALSNHADEALVGMTESELELTKKIFQALTTIDEHGRKIRRPVQLSELEVITGANKEELNFIINRFIANRKSFLVVSKLEEKDDKLIDISHESLIRQWSTLDAWVDEEAESAKIFLRLTANNGLYKENKRDLLAGSELQQILQWYYSFQPKSAWAFRYSSSYEESFNYLRKSEEQHKIAEREKEKQRLNKLRNLRILLAIAAVVVIVISILSYLNYQADIKTKNQLARNYWSNSQTARDENNPLASLHYMAEAVSKSRDEALTKNLLIDVQPFYPKTALEVILIHPDLVYKAIFSPDSKEILTICYDSIIRIWNSETGMQLDSLKKQDDVIYNAAFSEDGKRILTAGRDGTARIWNRSSGEQTGTSMKHDGAVWSTRFSADEQQIVTASEDGTVRLWETATQKQIRSFTGHRGVVFSAVFSADGTQILSAGDDSTARLWNISSGKQLDFVIHHSGYVNSAVFSADNKKILTASRDSTACVWDANTGKQMGPSLRHHNWVNNAIFSRDGKFILTSCYDKTARIWDSESLAETGTPMRHNAIIYSAFFSKDSKRIVTASGDSTARIWNISTEKNIIKSIKQENSITSATFSADGKYVVTAGMDSTARIWDIANGKIINPVLKHNGIVNSAVFSTDGKWILTSGNDSTARLWDVISGKQTGAVMQDSNIVRTAVFSPDGKQVLTSSFDGTARLWAAGSGILLQPVIRQEVSFFSAAFSPDGKKILTTDLNNNARTWDAVTGKPEGKLIQDEAVISRAFFSKDGKKIVTACFDSSAKIWDVKTGRQAGPALRHKGAVFTAVFNSDSKWVLTASADGTARVWETRTGKQIGASLRNDKAINSAYFSFDEKQILTAGANGTTTIWNFGGDLDIPADLFQLQARVITGVELNPETGELSVILPEVWYKLKDEYHRSASEHYKICHYPVYNFWRQSHAVEAEAVRSQY